MTPTLPAECAARFRLERLLGAGGFGTVYLTTQLALNRPAAVKVLSGGALDEEARGRFEREARVTATLEHPAIVVILDHGAAGVPWIAYEYLDGESLRARVEKGPLPPAEAAQAVRQVLGALACAHAAGVLHRDVKPDNVLRAGAGAWKLTDFGISKWARDGVQTKHGMVMGTAAYLAPEVLRGDPPGPAMDIYAAGIMLHELITGRVPFESGQLSEVLEMHLKREPEPPSARVPGLPPALDAVVARALAKDPARRFASAEEMAEALAALYGTGAVASRAGAKRTTRPVRAGGRPFSIWGPLALAAGVAAAALFGLKRSPEPVRKPEKPVARASPVAVWPALIGPLADGLRLELEAPREVDVTATVFRGGKEVARRQIPRAQTEPVDLLGLASETAYELRLSVPGRPVVPPRIPFTTRPPRPRELVPNALPAGSGLGPEFLLLLTSIEDLDGREVDRLAGLFRSAEAAPTEAFRRATALAVRMRSRPLFTALEQCGHLGAEQFLALADLALSMGDRDRSKKMLSSIAGDPWLYDPGVYARLAAELEGPAAAERLLALLEANPPFDVESAAHALDLAGAARARAYCERWLALPAPPPITLSTVWRSPRLLEQRARLERLALIGLARLDARNREDALGALLDDPRFAAHQHLAARLLTDSGRPQARARLYALPAARLASAPLIWECARAAVGETASDTARAALAKHGAALIEVMRGVGPIDVREAAAAALGMVPADQAVSALGEAVRGPEPRVAAAAAWALVTRRDRTHVDALVELACSDRDEKGVGAWAVGMLGSRSLTPKLAEVLARLPRDRSAMPRRSMVGWAMARLGNDGRGWLAMDDAKTDLTYGHFLRAHAKAGDDTLWLFPFVGYVPATLRLLPGQVVEAQASGYWCDERAGGWWPSPATRPFPEAMNRGALAVSINIGSHSTLLRVPPATVIARQSAPAVIRLTTPDSTEPLPVHDPDGLAGCAVVRLVVGPIP